MSSAPIPAAQSERTVTISFREYMQLFKDSCLLAELQAGGVDNWGGWDEINRDRIAATCRAERNRIIHGDGDPK